MKKIFITSSNTNAGKTLFTCALTDCIRGAGKTVTTLKPVITGYDFDKTPNDIFYICSSMGLRYTPENVAKINYASFTKPYSPDMAARIEKKPYINFQKLEAFCNKNTGNDYSIIESAGGVMAPLNVERTNIDLIKTVADSTILVVGSYLGSLSHTLSSYKILCDEGKKPVLLAVMQNLGKSDELYIPVMETVKSLEKFITTPIIGIEKLVGAEMLKISKLSKILGDAKILKITG